MAVGELSEYFMKDGFKLLGLGVAKAVRTEKVKSGMLW